MDCFVQKQSRLSFRPYASIQKTRFSILRRPMPAAVSADYQYVYVYQLSYFVIFIIIIARENLRPFQQTPRALQLRYADGKIALANKSHVREKNVFGRFFRVFFFFCDCRHGTRRHVDGEKFSTKLIARAGEPG